MINTLRHITLFLLVLVLEPWEVCAQSKFMENSLELGLEHFHFSPDLLGGGVAILDYDNDGWEDIYVTGGLDRDRLFRNIEGRTFEEVADDAGLSFTRYVHTTAVTAGDIDNDGDTDLFICSYKDHPNLLYLNRGNGTFRDYTLNAQVSDSTWSTGATMADFNGDGLLDIYVITYIDEPNALKDDQGNVIGFDHTCYPNLLYLNQGEAVFAESATDLAVDDPGCALAVLATDLNSDLRPDILIANDFGEWVVPNRAYLYDPVSETFIESSESLSLNDSIYGMGIAWGDINGDMIQDFYVTNIGGNPFRLSSGAVYEERGESYGISNATVGEKNTTGWGTMFLDHDNDADLDLYIANGEIFTADFLNTARKDPDKFFDNSGTGVFTDSTTTYGMGAESVSKGVSAFDYNHNGYLDVVVNTIERSPNAETNLLFYANQQEGKNWVRILPESSRTNRNAYGSTIWLVAQGEKQSRFHVNGGSHASSGSMYEHFGLSDANLIDSLVVDWPDGTTSVHREVGINKTYLLRDNGELLELGCNDPEAINYTGSSPFSYGCIMPEVTGIAQLNPLDDLAVYPNPFKNKLKIRNNSGEPTRIYLQDVTGKLVLAAEVVLHTELNTENLNPGVYLLKIPSRKVVYKMIKK